MAPPPFVMWMDGVEFGHVGIYSIIDEFIYPIPVGTHTKQWMLAPPARCPDDTLRHRRNTLTRTNQCPRSCSRDAASRCVRASSSRATTTTTRRMDTERERQNENVYIHLFIAGGRSRVARVEQRRGGMPNARAEEGRGSRATCIYPCETPSLVPRRVFRRRANDEE